MIRLSFAVPLFAVMSLAATSSEAQQLSSAERAYIRAVASYFQIPETELAILRKEALAAPPLPPHDPASLKRICKATKRNTGRGIDSWSPPELEMMPPEGW